MKKRKWTFGPEPVVDKLYACQNSSCPRSELELGFGDKNSRIEHESKCSYNLNQGANNSANTAKNSDLYAKKVLMLDHQPNDSEVAQHDTSWMNMAIERAEDDENHSAPDRQASSSSVEEYGHY